MIVVLLHESTMKVKQHPTLKEVYVSDTGEIWEEVSGGGRNRNPGTRYPRCILGHIHHDKYGYAVYTPRVETRKRYGYTTIKKFKVHQIVAQTWLDNVHNFKMVNHINYDKLDNRVVNLQWVSLAENNRGIHRMVKNYPQSLRIEALRLLLIDGLSIKEVNKLTGITTNTLSEAKRGDVWMKEREKFIDYLERE